MKRTILGAVCAAFLLTPGAPVFAQNNFCGIQKPPSQQPGVPETPPPCDPRCKGCNRSPCYVASGVYMAAVEDLSIPTTGYPLTASRRYESNRTVDGPLGIGWSSSVTPRLYYTVYLLTAPSTYTREAEVLMPDGSLYRFTANADNTFTPPVGRTDQLVRNVDGTFRLTRQHSLASLAFNADGTLASMTDGWGNSILFSYDASGRTQRVADAAGSNRYLDVTWNSSTGRIAMIADSAGRQIKYSYDADGTLVAVSDPVASGLATWSTWYAYTAGRFSPLLRRIEDRWHRTISDITWDASDRVHSYTDGNYIEGDPTSPGERYVYEYHPQQEGSVLPHTNKQDSFGTRTYSYDPNWLVNDTTTYDGLGRVVQSHSGNRIQSYDYDPESRVTSMSISTVKWKYTYDTTFPNRIATIIPYEVQPNNTEVRSTKWPGYLYQYVAAPSGKLGQIVVKRYRTDNVTLDRLSTQSFDEAGRITFRQDANDVSTLYTYNAAGDLLTTATPGVPGFNYGYDALGRTTSVTNGAGQTTTYTYDANDRIKSVTLPPPTPNSTLNFTTTISYDDYDSATGLVYDQTTDPNGRIRRSGTDALGHVVRSIDAANNVTMFTYVHAVLDHVTDPNGNVTSYAYDSNRQIRTATYPDGQSEEIAGGFPWRDRRGVVATLGYDEFGRVASRSFGGQSVLYQYDGYNLASITDGLQSPSAYSTLTYDSSFRLKTEQRQGEEKITYTYPDTAGYGGNLYSSYSVTPPAGTTGPSQTVTYSYDTAGRAHTMVWSAVSGTFTFDYTATSQYATITFPNGQRRMYTYDGQDRLLSAVNDHPAAGQLASFNYGYDTEWPAGTATLLGQRTSMLVSAPASAQLANGTTKYRYDADYQLVRADEPAGFEAWTYDGIGNRTSRSTQNGTTSYSYYHNGGNALNGGRFKGVSGTPFPFVYDANGNLTGTTAGTTYAWDNANRLTTALGTSYSYDDQDRRIRSVSGSSTTRYIVLGDHTIGERNATTGVATDYVFGPGMDEPLAKRLADGSIYYYVVDGLGSVVEVVDPAGAIQLGIRYTAWGEASMTGSGGELFGYTGREVAASSWNYRARHYDASIGRFTSEDPLGGTSRYPYAANNPVALTDPFGLFHVVPRRQPVRVPDIEVKCQRQSRVACTILRFMYATCDCRCTPPDYHPDVTVYLTYDMYIYSGTVRNQAHDSSIVDYASAVHHEQSRHLDPAMDEIRPEIEAFERLGFPLDECLLQCKSFSQGFSRDFAPYYRRALENTKNTAD